MMNSFPESFWRVPTMRNLVETTRQQYKLIENSFQFHNSPNQPFAREEGVGY